MTPERMTDLTEVVIVSVGADPESGVVPVAFLAVVEVVDADGDKQTVTITSHGLTNKRRAALAQLVTP